MRDVEVLRRLAAAPYDLVAYLHGNGWRVSATSSDELLWSATIDDAHWEVLQPLQADGPGGLRRLDELLSALASTRGMSPEAVYGEIVAAQADTVRVRVEPSTPSGTAPLEDALALVFAARDLLLVAAASVDSPRPVYGPRKPDAATDFVKSLRLTTEPGSFVLALQAPVHADFAASRALEKAGASSKDDSMFPPPAVPFPRRVTAGLMKAVSASLRDAALVAADAADLTIFDGSVPDGVSANLLEALVRLGATEGPASMTTRDFNIGVRWALNREPPSGTVSRLTITRDVVPVFADAAKSLRERLPEPDVSLTGHVVGLRRDSLSEPGSVTVSAQIPEGRSSRLRPVRLELDDPDYGQAVRAHQDRLPVEIRGDLIRNWGLSVSPVTSFEVLQAEGAV